VGILRNLGVRVGHTLRAQPLCIFCLYTMQYILSQLFLIGVGVGVKPGSLWLGGTVHVGLWRVPVC
jgi:hypothetical protein